MGVCLQLFNNSHRKWVIFSVIASHICPSHTCFLCTWRAGSQSWWSSLSGGGGRVTGHQRQPLLLAPLRWAAWARTPCPAGLGLEAPFLLRHLEWSSPVRFGVATEVQTSRCQGRREEWCAGYCFQITKTATLTFFFFASTLSQFATLKDQKRNKMGTGDTEQTGTTLPWWGFFWQFVFFWHL